ncbi:MAG: cadherin domain-containing protein [Cytophagales bacterium]|nr:cadherin domain-containing protein [Cytophagales bacterium]
MMHRILAPLFFVVCLPFATLGQTTFTVTNTDDSGAGTLRQAILDAEANPGADIIDLTGITGTITLSTGLPNITEDLTINGAGSSSTIIDGNNQVRPFFIGGILQSSTDAPMIAIDGLTIQNGYAEGESPNGNAGGGAGMGGGMFVNNGNVTMTNVLFSGNSVLGGTGGNDRFGGGGVGGDGPFENSGGVAAELPPGAFIGGTGGYGAGGGGGTGNFNFGGADGGSGGYGAGGGGAGGGNVNGLGNGGAAGAFGGSGANAISIAHAGGGGGAGLGGALYIRNGTVVLENIAFENNTATGGAGGDASPEPSGGTGQGRGGGVFNDTGTVTMTFFTFSGNITSTASPDTHGTIAFITDVAITADPADQLNINEGTDAAFTVTTTGTVESYQWQVDDGNGFSNITDDSNYSGAETATLDLTCVPRAFHNYQYRVQIGGSLNDVTSQSATLTVTNAADLVATIASTDLILQCDGESLTFTSEHQNVNTIPAYQWLLNGAPVQGETSDTFTGAVNEGDEITLELTESSSCFPRPVATSNSLIVQRIKVDTVVITNVLPGRTDVGSLPYHLAQTVNLPCNDIITVMDLRQLPQGSIISMDQALFTQSPVHIIGNGSDETIIRTTTNVSTAMLGRYHKLEGFKLENTSGFNFNGIDVFADSLVMYDVIISDFNSSSDEVLRYRNFDVDNNRGNYYVNIDSIQLLGGRQIDIDVEGTDTEITGAIKIANSVFKNAVHHNIVINFRESDFQEILIQGNLFQDNDLSTMQVFFNAGVAGGTVTIEQNSVINQYREVFALDSEPGLDIDVSIRNNTFSETGVRGFADFAGDYPVVTLDGVDVDIINNTMVGVQDVLSISTDNQVVFANNLVLDEVNGVNIFSNATPDYTGSGNNIGIDIGDNNDLTSTTLEVIQSLTLSDPGGNGLLVYEPVECGPAIGLANATYAPMKDQLGTLRLSPSDIGAIEGTLSVNEFIVVVATDPFPFPGDIVFTPTVSPEENSPTRTYTYEWFKNTVSSATTESFNATGLVAGDEIEVRVTPNNDFCLRPGVAIETVTIREAFSLQNTSVAENVVVGGVVSSIIPDGSLSMGATFSLVAGAGDTDNASFTVSGTDLLLASGLDFETEPSLSIRLSVSDGGNMFEQIFPLTITDVNDVPVFTSAPTTLLDRDNDFDYDIAVTDDEESFVTVEGITIPAWLDFNINPPAPETVLVTTEQTGLPQNARDFVVDAAGNFYYTDRFDDVIYKMDVNGVQTVIADANSAEPIFSPAGMDIAPDGTIYVAIFSGGPNFDGGIYTIVNDVLTFLVEVEEVQEVAVSNDNDLYAISRSKLYKIENGVATVVAGTANRSVTDGPVGVGQIANPSGMDVAPDGTIWFRDGSTVRFVTADGTITSITPDPTTSDVTSIPFGGDLKVDVLGDVYFNSTAFILKMTPGTSSWEYFIGLNAGASVDGDQNTALWGRMEALYFDSDGNLWTLGSSANTSSIPQEVRKIVIPPSTYSLNGNASIVGEFPVSLRASDGATTTDQDFTIEVLGPLHFEADPVTAATEGAQYIYNPSAIHSQSTAFTYGFTLPDWLDTSVPHTATSFLNIASGVPGVAPLSKTDATVTDEAVYTIQGSSISVIKYDGTQVSDIDFSSLNPMPSFIGPLITSNTNGELYFALTNSSDQEKLYKVNPNADPIVFSDLGTFDGIKDIDSHENGVVILERRFNNSVLVGDISIVDDAGMVTSVISGSEAESINVGLDGKIYFLGGSNFQPDDHSEFIADLELNGTFTTRTIFSDERVYSVQDLVVDAFGNAYILYESLDQMANIYDSYGYLGNSSSVSLELFTATDDVNTFEISGFTRFGSTNDIFYITNDATAGTSDLFAYADNQVIFGIPGATDGGLNNVTITLDDQNEVVTQTFDINVNFINDAPTGLEISGNSIDENNPTTTALLTFNTLDPDGTGDTYTYTLVSGMGDANNGEFTIVDDGLLATISYDAESNPGTKSIRVRSMDVAGEFVEETFDITINDINEAPTAIALSGDMEIDENLDAGTLLGMLTTTDEDAGDGHTYALSGVGSDLFQVVGDELQTAAVLDFEMATSYTLTVTTEDVGQLTHDEDFTITIIDDAPTDITLSNSSVDEGLIPGALVGTFITTDSDPNNTFTYSFVSGINFNAFFEIDGDVLKTKALFNASQFTSAIIRVKTTDAIGESFEKDLTITINDLTNSAPQLLNAPTGTATQGQLYTFAPGGFDFDGDNITYSKSGADWLIQQDQPAIVEEFLAQNGTNNLEIDDNDNLYMTILGASGFATNLLKYDDDTETTSTLLTTDATSITFVDTDDNGVIYFSDNNFGGSSYQVKKMDNGTVTSVYSATGEVTAGGYHDDDYLVLVETQADGTKDIVRIGLDGSSKTTLEEEVGFVGVFNIGEDDLIHFSAGNEMSAIDIDGDAATAVTLALTTDNTNSPYLYFISDFVKYSSDQSYVLYVEADAAGTQRDVLVRVTPSGEEELWRGTVTYEASKIAANARSEVYFTRDADSDGVNAVAVYNAPFTFFYGTPEDADVGTSNFDLNLTDGELSNDYSFTIDVENVNDAPTSITLNANAVDENNSIGIVVATISSEDPDNDSGDNQTFTLVGGEGDTDNGSFEIVGSELKTLATFDHESGATKSIRIQATDDSNATFEQTLSIDIADLNESPTAIELSAASINENEAAGTVIGTLTTVDPDETNDNLVFEIIEGADNFQLSGLELQSSASFNFEANPSLTVKVRASDGVENSNTFFTIEETFTINVGDVSESPSDIALSNTTVAENAASGTVIGSLSAQDPDGANTNTFSLVENSEDNASFDISEGQLVTVDVFDFESQTSYTVDVAVNDGGGNTLTEKITIAITDVNEAPVFSSESSFTITENTTGVATVSAIDEDANATFTYSIVDGTDKDLFNLSGSELAFVSAPDFESADDVGGDNTYEVTVRVSDGTNDVDQALTVTITDENEAPVFNNDAAVSVEENSTTVATLSATDQDAGTTLAFSITGGTDQAVFSLSGSDLAFVSAPDFESPTDSDGDNQYEVSVQVSDGTNTADLNMTVAVTDLTTAPTFTSDSEISVVENTSDVITLVASTSEGGGTLTYSLVDGQDASSFDLDGAVLTFISAPDFEDPTDEDANNVYALTVRVSDGSSDVDQTLTISVTDENEAPVFNTVADVNVVENSTEVAVLSATDQDTDAVLTYSIVGGADQGLFSLSGSSLTFTSAPDFETPSDIDGDNHYEVDVQVSDGTNDVVLNMIVSVTDENEAPIISTASAQTIQENTAGPIILNATDPDGTATLTYSIVNGTDKDLFSLTGNELSFITAPDFENAADDGVDNDYEVTVFVFDDTHATELNLIVTVTDVNEAPVFNTSTEVSVEENTTIVTSLSATDPDVGATITYSISGGADQEAFALSESDLTFKLAPDFESPADADGDNNYEVEVQASDGTNNITLSMIVTVTDLTKVPVFTSDSEVSVLENTTEVVTLTVSSEEAVGTSTFSLVEGQDAELFELDGAELTFKSAADFETPDDADDNNVYLLTVRASDGTNEVDQAMSITVTNVNEAPTSFSITGGGTVDEGADVGTLVGTLTSTDEDATFTHVYSLPESETNFKISGNELLTNAVFDFDDQSSYDVTIIVTDEGGLTFSASPTITINELINNKPNSSIEINSVGDVVVGASAFPLSAITNPENATVVWSVLEGDATIDGSTLTPGTQPGLVVVKAVIEETDDFNASEDTESFNLVDPTLINPNVTITLPAESPANETVTIAVTFDAQGATTVTETDVVLSVESGPGEITGNELSFAGAGTVVVRASLAATDETNAVFATASIEVFNVYNISGRALADGDGFSNGIAYLVALDNVNETINVPLSAEGNFTFQNVREGEYFLGVGVPQTETTYLSTFLGDVSPILDQTAAPDILKLAADVSGLVINMQSKPAPAVELVDPETGGKIEFQAQGTTNGQSRFIMGRVEMGDPIPNTQVVLSTAEGEYIADGLTDENGFIIFEGLPTGDYRIGVEIPGVGRVETEIPVEEGEQADVTGLISEDGTVALEVEEVLNVGLDAEQALTIYPNPVVDELNLTIENDYRGELTFRVFDMNGRKVLGFIRTKQFQRMDLSERLDIPEGTYVILINGIDLNLQQRFIKR